MSSLTSFCIKSGLATDEKQVVWYVKGAQIVMNHNVVESENLSALTVSKGDVITVNGKTVKAGNNA